MSRDEPPGVEFVDEPAADGHDVETLEAGRRRSRPGIGWTAVALLAVAAVATSVLVTRGGADRPAASPEPSPSAPSTVVALPGTTNLDTDGAALFGIPDRTRCPETMSCLVDADVTVALASAMFDAFPYCHVYSARTVHTVANHLWFRQITATGASLRVLVEIARPAAVALMARPTPDDGRTVQVRQQVRGLIVAVRVDGPPDALPSVGELRALAENPRLTL